MNIGILFHEILVRPIINVLLAIYHVLLYLHVPYPLGFSIIFLTILIRFVIYPFTASQLVASKKMQDMAPHLSRVKEKHKGDARRIQEETMKLYKEHGVNPLAGCLPVLIQLPLIWALYTVLQEVVKLNTKDIVVHINKLAYAPSFGLSTPWDSHFFGVSLGQTPSALFQALPLIVLVPILTGVFQFIQSKMIVMPKKPDSDNKKEKSTEEDFASAFQTQSLYVFPAMIGFFSFTFPIGLSLYWNTFTLFGILQQYKLQGLGGLTGLAQQLFPARKQKKK